MRHCKGLGVLVGLGFALAGGAQAQAQSSGGGGCHGDGLDGVCHHCGGDNTGTGDCSSAATTSFSGGDDGLTTLSLSADGSDATGFGRTPGAGNPGDGLDGPLHICGGNGGGDGGSVLSSSTTSLAELSCWQ